MTHDDHIDHVAAAGGGFAAGLLCGVAIGAAVGLLFAPTEGRRLRQQIGDGAGRFQRQAKDRYHDASRAVSSVVERGREAVDAGRETFQKARTSATEPGAYPTSSLG
jgi:gas vesicle protein